MSPDVWLAENPISGVVNILIVKMFGIYIKLLTDFFLLDFLKFDNSQVKFDVHIENIDKKRNGKLFALLIYTTKYPLSF